MHGYDSYEIGERIDHVEGMTIEEAEHRLATRLISFPARVTSTPTGAREPLRPLLWCTAAMSLASPARCP